MDEATPLARAVDQFVDHLLRGSAEDVEVFLARHPDLGAAEVARVQKLARVFGGRGPRQTTGGALPFERLGAYRLIERLGAGGMGIVYLAEDERLARRVALKVVRPELAASAETLARFEREARAVAKLSHEHIVTVFEAGRVDDVAFLAMEYVPGQSLDEHFAAARAAESLVPTRDLLRYALEVARALAAAHAAGVVHRDVKPSNIRVTPEGRALLLDFGLARDTSSASLSRTGQVQGTLYYASPEQLGGGSAEVDTRTDVWSLGVTLYEGLTGRRPFDGERTEEVLRRITLTEPVSPRTLVPDLSRDVETVVLEALEKDPARRYASAAALAADLAALLDGRPIAARPTGSLTRAWKWSRRKPAHAAALALVALVATGGPLTYAVLQARHARELTHERNVAKERAEDLEELVRFQGKTVGRIAPERMARSLVDTLVEEARAGWRAAGLSDAEANERAATLTGLASAANTTNLAVTALRTQVIEPSLAAAREDFAARPGLQGLLLHQIGVTCWSLGLLELALETQRDAYELLARHTSPDGADTSLARANLGQFLMELGRPDEAAPHLEAGVAGLARAFGDEDPRTLIARQSLAMLAQARGDLDGAARTLEDLLAIRRRAFGDSHEGTLRAIADLGAIRFMQGRREEAEPLLREAYDRRRELPTNGAASEITAANNLAVLLRELGKLDDAIVVLEDALATAQREHGDRHPTTAHVSANLAFVLARAGRHAEAEPLMRAGLEATRAQLGPTHVDTLTRASRLADVLVALGRHEEALELARSAGADARARHGLDAPPAQWLAATEVTALAALGRHGEAAESLAAARPAVPPEAKLAAAAEALFAAAPRSPADSALVDVARRAWAPAD